MPLGLVGSGGGSGEKEPPRPAKEESRPCVQCCVAQIENHRNRIELSIAVWYDCGYGEADRTFAVHPWQYPCVRSQYQLCVPFISCFQVIVVGQSYCRPCFLAMVAHKFRGVLGRRRVLDRPGERGSLVISRP